jgi:excinuclease UvrABC helicase subunit UvrB
MKLGKRRKLKIKVGGDTVRIIRGAQDEDVKFLENLDDEISRINDVFKCLSTVDKSVYPDWEDHLVISFQCHRLCLRKAFCHKVIASMEDQLTEKMQLKTRISTGGFIDYSR